MARWIGALFALGALQFSVASLLGLWPAQAMRWSLSPQDVNTLFFVGSIFFTLAAYLQVVQSANAVAAGGREYFGWHPSNVLWLACVLQFTGTLLFNLSTFDAIPGGLDWVEQDLLVWTPDMAGSMLFLASGCLCLIDAGDNRQLWQPGIRLWRIEAVNLVGCISFMLAAVSAFVPPGSGWSWLVELSLLTTLTGAMAFFAGALMLVPRQSPC